MSADPNCVFCKIVAGELPSTKVYENDHVLAFMDIGPIVKGHTLVIPKEHCDPITAVPATLLQHLILATQSVAAALTSGLGADGINITQANGRVAGQVVPHVHFHVIPRFDDDGHSWNWTPGEYRDMSEMGEIAGQIRDAIREA